MSAITVDVSSDLHAAAQLFRGSNLDNFAGMHIGAATAEETTSFLSH
jgi:hypothetical protein